MGACAKCRRPLHSSCRLPSCHAAKLHFSVLCFPVLFGNVVSALRALPLCFASWLCDFALLLGFACLFFVALFLALYFALQRVFFEGFSLFFCLFFLGGGTFLWGSTCVVALWAPFCSPGGLLEAAGCLEARF